LDDKIRICTAPDGVRIAYASVGSGPQLVKAAHWLTHVQYDLESPVWRPWVREFSRQYTYIRYDERGFGLSDRDVENFSFESWVRDLETVADALGLERFDLLGNSQGGPVSIAYAVRHRNVSVIWSLEEPLRRVGNTGTSNPDNLNSSGRW